MNREYWKLFWTTGMPEAWLMSRDGETMPPSGAAQGLRASSRSLSLSQGGGAGAAGSLAGSPAPVSANVPGSPGNLY